MTVQPYGVRLTWADVPAVVHDWAQKILGADVVDARSQPGGFSPGVAVRLVAANGRRGFVKAVSPAQNPDTPNLLRREVDVLASMPGEVGVPALLAGYDDGKWVALLIEDVEGRHPHTPWQDTEVRATFTALADLRRHRAPGKWPALDNHLADMFAAWPRIAAQLPADLHPWLADQLDELDELSSKALARLAGDAIAHADTRSDNLLVTPQGRVRIVDWPWASRGAPWFDAVTLLVNLELYGGVPPTTYLPRVRDLGRATRTSWARWQAYADTSSKRPPSPHRPGCRRSGRSRVLRAWRAGVCCADSSGAGCFPSRRGLCGAGSAYARRANAQVHHESVGQAFERIRRHARNNHVGLGSVASAIVDLGLRL